jgi:hypothetical protein
MKARANNEKDREESGRVGGGAGALHMPIRLQIASQLVAARMMAHGRYALTEAQWDKETLACVRIADELIKQHNDTLEK